MPSIWRRRWFWAALVLLVAIVLYVTWRRPQAKTDPAAQAGLLSSTECPFHDQKIQIVTGEGIQATYDTLPLVGVITGIPEFHDCQRFIDVTGSSYGPLVGIYATSNLARVDYRPVDDALRGREQGLRADPARADEPYPLPELNPRAAAVAVIVNFDKVDYAPLGIESGVNCLFVFPEPGAPYGLAARMVPVGAQASGCASGATISEPGTSLLVSAHRMNNDHPNDYPSVARWDWDPTSKTQFIGLKCGTRWCAIRSPNTSEPATPPVFGGITDPKERRVFTVRGWHDEQWLAHPAGGTVVPQAFRGTLVPVKDLSGKTTADFTSAWVDVARVSITPHAPVYQTKFGFTASSMPEQMNRIALCTGTWDACIAAGGLSSPTVTKPNCVGGGGEAWWARITNTQSQHRYFCVTRKEHAGVTMPGTARWRWLNTDETIWVECDFGCCQVQGGGT